MSIALDYLPAWDGTGRCVGQPDRMYPTTEEELGQALATCRACPVLDQCRDWVLSIPEHLGPDGVVAGMTAPQRERIILGQLPPKKCADCKAIKPQYEFGINTPGRAARRAICRACANARSAKPQAARTQPKTAPAAPAAPPHQCTTCRPCIAQAERDAYATERLTTTRGSQ
ncbi:WhiB family transcriptional regulator [Nonomuraea indica]|uniref:WhiB family transcriptional regulator n=1 Tax=Nonomuraea indica TaxID=1581193 RepID=UPI000C7BE7F9|nr:WhiB family transcriptional regulator [Nonomuraea indica]